MKIKHPWIALAVGYLLCIVLNEQPKQKYPWWINEKARCLRALQKEDLNESGRDS